VSARLSPTTSLDAVIGIVLALKLTLAPALVAAATRVARRLGHRAGGLVGGLPVVAGPIVLIYAVEHGEGFARAAAAATVLGVISTVTFCVVYALSARRARWPVSLIAGWSTFGVATALLSTITPPLGVSAMLAIGAVTVATLILGRLASPGEVVPAERDLLAWRIVITAALVLVLTALASTVSAHLAGLLAPFPIITAVLAAFTQAHGSADAAAELLGGLVPALGCFVVFFGTIALGLPSLGTGGAFTVASLVTFACWTLLLLFTRVSRRVAPGAQRNSP
jgi:hypothetical protein